MKKLLTLCVVLALSCVLSAQTHTLPTLDRNNTWTGAQTDSALHTFNGGLVSLEVNGIYNSAMHSGADMCVRIQNAFAAGGNANVVVDARNELAGACSVNPLANITGQATLLLPGVTITTSAQWYTTVSNVIVRGQGWQTLLLANSSTFPVSTPLIKVGDNTSSLVFGTRFESIYASCNGVVNCQTYVGSGLNEASGLLHFNSNNTPNNTSTAQIQINFGAVTTGHFVLDDLQLSMTGANDGIVITGTSAAMMGKATRITCNNTGLTTGLACLHVNASNSGGVTVQADNIHSEGFGDTIKSDGFASVVGETFDCTGTCTNVIHIASAKMQKFSGIWQSGGAQLVLNDQYSGCSVTASQEQFVASYRQSSTTNGAQVYIDGGRGGAPNVCNNDTSGPRFLVQSGATTGAGMVGHYDLFDGNGNGWQVLYAATATPNTPLNLKYCTGGASSPSCTTEFQVTKTGLVSATAIAGTGTATFAAGASAGTSPGTPTCTTSHVCDSYSGTISFTMGTSTAAGVALIVTTSATRTNQASCVGAMYLAASPFTAIPIRMTATTTTAVFNTGTAPTASTAYELTYVCGGN